ncbi:MAG: helix-turn-helix domain-containing protein [Candidatus Paceibacterota bacterium]
MLPTQEGCEVQDLTSSHNYRTEIPNIIFHLKLNPWAFKAYSVIKMTAGDHGKCFKSNSRMSEEVGCSLPTLIKLKAELVEQGLITIEKRKHSNGSDLPDLIRIVDIWPQNAEYMLKLYPKNPKNDLWPWKPREGKGDLGGGVNAVKGEGKRRLHKQDPIQQDLKEQQQEPAAVFSEKKEEKKPKVYAILETVDIPLHDKEEITRDYSEEKVIYAVNFCLDPGFKLKGPLAAAIKWACKVKPEESKASKLKKKQKQDLEQQELRRQIWDLNRGFAMQFHGAKSGEILIKAWKDSVEIRSPYGSINIIYADDGFTEMFNKALMKYGFEIPEES